jgi:hypothetical protein
MAFKIDPVWIVVALIVYALFFRRKSGYGGSGGHPMAGVRMKGPDYDTYISTSGMQERTGPQAIVNFAPANFGDDDE